MGAFSGKIAVVTGGASGLGRGLCEQLGRDGAIVVVTDVNEPGARQVADEIDDAGGQAMALRLDVTDSEQVREVLDQIISSHGRLDYVFNNAGIGCGGEFQDATPDVWRQMVNVNLLGAAYVMHYAYLQMIKQGAGQIVNIASIYGVCPGVLAAPYSATKHALAALGLSVQPEASAFGIDITTICPGYLDTNIFAAAAPRGWDEKETLSRVPFKLVSVETAVRRILRAVRRRRLLYVFPWYANGMWRLQRLSPSLMAWVNAIGMRGQRKRFGTTAKR
jgi:NAD(P)-dependent dehydrogenase (short-subunit alcohol dehydrogenase family)